MNSTTRNARNLLSIALICLFLSACASVVRNPLPENLHQDVTVLGRGDLRLWGDGVHFELFPGIDSTQGLQDRYAGIMHREHDYLVISGGGANGAYGAGVLKAWSEMGTRPEFTVVTGVSTGALIAPFAFLGSDYDAKLEQLYTSLDTTQLIRTRGFFSIFGADSIVDTTPLSSLLEESVDEEMIKALAREYRKGRALLIGTTNLDAGRPVVWNLTRIASTGQPGAARLIQNVLLASASIPGAFPPVYVKVKAGDGQEYDEMHVDGGVSSQMFFYPPGIDWDRVEEILGVRGTPTIHLIRNAFIHSQYEVISPQLVPIAGRTISSLIRTQGIGDFFRIWTLAQRDGLDLKVTWIPDEVRTDLGLESTEAFDPKYMKALFEFGYQQTMAGNTWKNFGQLMNEIDQVKLTDLPIEN